MSFVMIPEELLDVKLSSAQFRALINIINNTYSTGKYAGCCCLGYKILADKCFTDKSAMIKTVKQLEELGFVEIDKREKFNRSNALRLTIENGLKRCCSGMAVLDSSSFYGCQKPTDKGCQNTTDKGCQNTTEGCLKTTLGCLKPTPHIDLKFKTLDLKQKNACARAEDGCLKPTDRKEQIAPVDRATGRTMPDGGQAAGSLAKKEVTSADVQQEQDLTLLRAIKANFKDIEADLELFRVANWYGLRKKSKFSLIEDIRAREVLDWMAARGVIATYIPDDRHYSSEIIIREVA